MKQMRIVCAFALALAMFLGACGSSDPNEETVNSEKPESQTQQEMSQEQTDEHEETAGAESEDMTAVLMPVAQYESEAEAENGVGDKFAYDEYGHCVLWEYSWINPDGKVESRQKTAEFTYDAEGRPSTVKTALGDTINYFYDANGGVSSISGTLAGESFGFYYSEAPNSRYECKMNNSSYILIKRYSENYDQLEQLYFKSQSDTEPYHTYINTYENGILISRLDTYVDKYEFDMVWSADDYDEMGHCLRKQLVGGTNNVYSIREDVYEGFIETDSDGNIVKDVHTQVSDDYVNTVTFEYQYDNGEMNALTYTLTANNGYYAKLAYEQIDTVDDELVQAFITLYLQDHLTAESDDINWKPYGYR